MSSSVLAGQQEHAAEPSKRRRAMSSVKELPLEQQQALLAGGLLEPADDGARGAAADAGDAADAAPDAGPVPGSGPLNPSGTDWSQVIGFEFLGGGGTNKGLVKVWNAGQRQCLVVKFTNEDQRRAEMADVALTAAGAQNAGTRMSDVSGEGQLVLARLAELATHDAALAKELATLNAKKPTTAQSLSVQQYVGGVDMGDVYLTAQNRDRGQVPAQGSIDEVSKKKTDQAGGVDVNMARMTTPTFLRGLGQISAADCLTGNMDQVAAMAAGGGVGKLNPKNLKVAADDTAGAVDDDTQLFGYELFSKLNVKPNPKAWADYLCSGGEVYSDYFAAEQVMGSAARGVREAPSLETLFDTALMKAVYEDFSHFVPGVSEGVFVQHFRAGAQLGVQNMLAHLNELRAGAQRTAGADRGGEFIDPEALEVKLAYLSERSQDPTEQGREKATNVARQTALLLQLPKLPPELLQAAPDKPAELSRSQKVSRFIGRKLGRGQTGSERARGLKEQAETLNEDALDAGLADMENATDVGARRQATALFELKLQKTVRAASGKNQALGEATAFLTSYLAKAPAEVRQRILPVLDLCQADTFHTQVAARIRQTLASYQAKLHGSEDAANLATVTQTLDQLNALTPSFTDVVRQLRALR